jgi:predicted acetyltransferase
MSVPELERRMRDWLASEYAAILFEEAGTAVAYCLYREQAEEVYLRQFFVVQDRRRGIGRYAFKILRSKIWPRAKRLTVDVLVHNTVGIAFWRAVGCRDYSLTLELLPDRK